MLQPPRMNARARQSVRRLRRNQKSVNQFLKRPVPRPHTSGL